MVKKKLLELWVLTVVLAEKAFDAAVDWATLDHYVDYAGRIAVEYGEDEYGEYVTTPLVSREDRDAYLGASIALVVLAVLMVILVIAMVI